MGRLMMVVERNAGVSALDLALAWDGDAEARALGVAVVEAPPTSGTFGVDIGTLVVIPLAVNVATTAITVLVGRLVSRLRPERAGELSVEVSVGPGDEGDVVVIVRLAGHDS
jgi:hypothetical protein